MPTYEYACRSCGRHIDVQQAFTDDALTTCPTCGGPLRKVFGNIAIAFKGSGFYSTDNRSMGKRDTGSKGESDGAGSDGETKAESSDGSSKSDGKSDGKSEPKSSKAESGSADAGSKSGGSGAASSSGSNSSSGDSGGGSKSKSGDKSPATAT